MAYLLAFPVADESITIWDAPSTPDLDLLRRTFEHIDAHPEQWHQGCWLHQDEECGTVACVAGWACLLAGDEVASDGLVLTPKGQRIPVDARAANLLGLTYEEAGALFSANNTRWRLHTIAQRIAQRAGLHWNMPAPERFRMPVPVPLPEMVVPYVLVSVDDPNVTWAYAEDGGAEPLRDSAWATAYTRLLDRELVSV